MICISAIILTSKFVNLTLKIYATTANDLSVWDGTEASELNGGTGTEQDPYLIANGGQLYHMLNVGAKGNRGYCFKLTNDIYLNDVSNPDWKTNNPNEWFVDGQFGGKFDGDGHTVYGIYYKDGVASYAGLIPKVYVVTGKSVEIKNVGVENSYISGKSYAGGIVAEIGGNSTETTNLFNMSQCYVADDVTVKAATGQGGLIGFQGVKYTTISDCYFIGDFGNDFTNDGILICWTWM